MIPSQCPRVLLAVILSLLGPAELASQEMEPKSPKKALVLSTAGTLLPIAAGAIVLATRPRGGTDGPADETYDVVGGIIIGLGAGVGPSLGHFYAHQMGWVVPRVLVGGALGLLAAGEDLDAGVGIALAGATLVSVMAIRDIATAPAAARRYNTRQRLALTALPSLEQGRLGLKLGVAARL